MQAAEKHLLIFERHFSPEKQCRAYPLGQRLRRLPNYSDIQHYPRHPEGKIPGHDLKRMCSSYCNPPCRG